MTELLLAGGAMAKLLVRTAGESSWLGALRQRAIRKLLLAGAPWRNCWYGQPAEAASQGAVAKKLATPWRIAIGKKAQWQKCPAAMQILEKSVHLQHKIN